MIEVFKSNYFRSTKSLFFILMSNQKKRIFFFLSFTLIISILEILSLGSVIPITLTILSPEKIYDIEIIKKILDFLQISNHKNLILILFSFFAIIFLFLGFCKSISTYLGIKISLNTSLYLSSKTFQRIVFESYSFHKNYSGNSISSLILTKCSEISVLALQLANLINAFIIFFFISIFMLIINYQITLACYLTIFFLYFFLIKKFKYVVFINSKKVSNKMTELYKIVNAMINGIKNIILNKEYSYYNIKFYNTNLELLNSIGQNKFIAQLPKILIETFVFFTIIIIVVILLILEKNIVEVMTYIIFFAFCFQRILPLINQIYVSYSTTAGLRGSYGDVFKLVEGKINKKISLKKIKFNNKIEFCNVEYKYPESKKIILQNINIKIKKGEKIGIIGSSGSGKSTFLDLFMGLLQPTKGKILIDNYNLEKNNINLWQDNISYSSQNVPILDSTFEKNITNKAKYSKKKLINSLKNAEIFDYIQSQTYGIFSNAGGDQGKRLSNGQIQKVGIARIFFKNTDVIVLDEATNALDPETEKLILNKIFSLKNKTVIICSHKYENLKQCDKIYRLNKKNFYKYKKKENI